MLEIEVVHGDDWQGLYANGSLIDENHKIETYDIVNLINNNINLIDKESGIIFNEAWCDINWFEDIGNFPERLDEVKFPDYSEMF